MDKFCSPYNFTTDWNAENHDGLPSYGWYLSLGNAAIMSMKETLVVINDYHPVKDVCMVWSSRIFLWLSELLSPLIIAESKGKRTIWKNTPSKIS